MGGEVLELGGALAQAGLKERRQDAGQRAESGRIRATTALAHQERPALELDREREQRAQREFDVVIGRATSEAAQQTVPGDTELGVIAQLVAPMLRRAVEEMRRSLGEIDRIDPARADQRLLAAWSELRSDFRSFRTDRVLAATYLEEKYPERRDVLRAKWRQSLVWGPPKDN